MAFSDQQAGRARAIVLIVALIVVAALAVAVVSGVFSPAAQSGGQSGQEQAISTDGSETLADGSAMESIDAQYGTAAQQLASQYEADPTNPSALLNLANGYFDWGVAAMNHAASDEDSAHARELLARAVEYYDTYLADNPGAKSATVDRAICVFYAGDTDQAIEALEALISDDPSFAPAWANLGMFYESQGSTEKAVDAYRRAIEASAEDDAYNVGSYAQERLDALEGAS